MKSNRPSRLSPLLFALTLLAGPAGAQMGMIDLVCTGTARQAWDPGLRLSNRDVSYSNESSYGECLSREPLVNAGQLTAQSELTTSCVSNLGPTRASVTWNDGSSSTFSVQGAGIHVVEGTRAFVSIGMVTEGRFQGDAVVMTYALSPMDLAPCLYSGLNALSGPTTLRLTRLF
ncbi:hypothetical protein LXT21_27225 [Myxococcus sp. K38C18041901]|uniref:hypothetical protein n=1 Tax=Myxococcus guangdongensis TaxID=2906760 RepID=UPI0020A80F6E|nr:hypothetical protein [Myxococcus guangdongensis]MCP3062489.1 hypothetical protein [Myxococcus guangdongensis]